MTLEPRRWIEIDMNEPKSKKRVGEGERGRGGRERERWKRSFKNLQHGLAI